MGHGREGDRKEGDMVLFGYQHPNLGMTHAVLPGLDRLDVHGQSITDQGNVGGRSASRDAVQCADKQPTQHADATRSASSDAA